MSGRRAGCAAALAVVALAAVDAVAGCGSADSRLANGQALFANDCSACHTLSGRPSPSHQGGDLRALHVGRAAMLQFTAEMPMAIPLTGSQVAEVADYVLSVQRRSAPR